MQATHKVKVDPTPFSLLMLGTFADRLARQLNRMPEQIAPAVFTFVLTVAETPVTLALNTAPRSNDRAQYELHTLPETAFKDLPPAKQWDLARFHMKLVELVIAWEETEDVDAAQIDVPPGAHV